MFSIDEKEPAHKNCLRIGLHWPQVICLLTLVTLYIVNSLQKTKQKSFCMWIDLQWLCCTSVFACNTKGQLNRKMLLAVIYIVFLKTNWAHKTNWVFMFTSQVRHDFFCRATKIQRCYWKVVHKHRCRKNIHFEN